MFTFSILIHLSVLSYQYFGTASSNALCSHTLDMIWYYSVLFALYACGLSNTNETNETGFVHILEFCFFYYFLMDPLWSAMSQGSETSHILCLYLSLTALPHTVGSNIGSFLLTDWVDYFVYLDCRLVHSILSKKQPIWRAFEFRAHFKPLFL